MNDFFETDDESLRLLMQDASEDVVSINNTATNVAHHALTTFKTRKQRRQKLRNAATPVFTLMLLIAGTFFWNHANRAKTDSAARFVDPERLAEQRFEAQLALLQDEINNLQAQVAEQKRLFDEYEQRTALELKLATKTGKTQEEKIANLNRELDRRLELEKNASTFLNFARKYAAENKKELAIAEYNVVLRSFSESETANIAREELNKIGAY